MALFEFELAKVEDIEPWQTGKGPDLSWFALTDGRFWMPVGDRVLFEYTDEISAHWGAGVHVAEYQVAAFVREMLGCVAAASARLPPRLEKLASTWGGLSELVNGKAAEEADDDRNGDSYTAWRWLGERSPWASYLVDAPRVHFVRIGEEVRIHWDNRDRLVDGHQVWTAQLGVHTMPVEAFVSECRSFANRLLDPMEARIAAIDVGTVSARVALDTASLRQQHETWRTEFGSYFGEYQPDISWPEAECAIERIARQRGASF
ncbi:MAG: DUF5984 family protein [Polyangiaceae bacterium]